MVKYYCENDSGGGFQIFRLIGVDKTTLLEWAHEHTPGRSALINCGTHYGGIFDIHIEACGIETDAKKVAEKETAVLQSAGKTLSAVDVANASSGLQARIVNTARTGEIQRDEVWTQAEEIDIAPVFLMLAAGLMVFRYLGRGTDAKDFVLLGGVGMVGLIFVRGIFQKGKEK